MRSENITPTAMLERLRQRLTGAAPPVEVEDDSATDHALTWVTPDRSGTAPSIRNGHTADLIDSRIYIFGGGDKADLLADLHVFDVRDHSWSEPPCTGTAPPARSRHSIICISMPADASVTPSGQKRTTFRGCGKHTVHAPKRRRRCGQQGGTGASVGRHLVRRPGSCADARARALV